MSGGCFTVVVNMSFYPVPLYDGAVHLPILAEDGKLGVRERILLLYVQSLLIDT